MIELGAWPDAEAVVMTMLEGIATTVTSTPPEITSPVIRVQRVGGADDYITDYPTMAVAVLYPLQAEGDTAAAWTMAEHVRQKILASPATQVGAVLVDRATTVTPAAQQPYDNPGIRFIPAIYQLEWRRPRS